MHFQPFFQKRSDGTALRQGQEGWAPAAPAAPRPGSPGEGRAPQRPWGLCSATHTPPSSAARPSFWSSFSLGACPPPPPPRFFHFSYLESLTKWLLKEQHGAGNPNQSVGLRNSCLVSIAMGVDSYTWVSQLCLLCWCPVPVLTSPACGPASEAVSHLTGSLPRPPPAGMEDPGDSLPWGRGLQDGEEGGGERPALGCTEGPCG